MKYVYRPELLCFILHRLCVESWGYSELHSSNNELVKTQLLDTCRFPVGNFCGKVVSIKFDLELSVLCSA